MRRLKVLDLFCGAGGLSRGFGLLKDFKILAGIDIFPPALETFYFNHKDTTPGFHVPTDISALDAKQILKRLATPSIDVVVGGPPCQGFSVAGPRDPKDGRNKLVWHFVRLIEELEPLCFVMENVFGMIVPKVKAFVDEVVKKIEKAGYAVGTFLLNAQDYGVPQSRKRLFIVGSRLGRRVPMPPPISAEENSLFYDRFVTVRDALSDLPTPLPCEPQEYTRRASSRYQELMRGGSTALYNHTPARHGASMVRRMKEQDPGTRLYNNWNHAWYKLDLNRPAPTVKENHRAPFVHPIEPRVTTPRECARLQSFPDWYIFKGTKSAQLIQIGNAVPPLLARAIAESVASALKNARKFR